MAAIEELPQHPDMAGMIEVSVIFSGDTMLTRSLFTAMALEGPVETLPRRPGARFGHARADDGRTTSRTWQPHARRRRSAASPRGADRGGRRPRRLDPAGFAVRIRPLLGISAGAPAEAEAASYDVKGGARVDVGGAPRTTTAPRRTPARRSMQSRGGAERLTKIE